MKARVRETTLSTFDLECLYLRQSLTSIGCRSIKTNNLCLFNYAFFIYLFICLLLSIFAISRICSFIQEYVDLSDRAISPRIALTNVSFTLKEKDEEIFKTS